MYYFVNEDATKEFLEDPELILSKTAIPPARLFVVGPAGSGKVRHYIIILCGK
jgi:hypothetical protein